MSKVPAPKTDLDVQIALAEQRGAEREKRRRRIETLRTDCAYARDVAEGCRDAMHGRLARLIDRLAGEVDALWKEVRP